MISTNRKEFPILEFDDCREAVIEPAIVSKRIENMPECCVLCYFGDAVEALKEGLLVLAHFKAESLSIPVYEYAAGNNKVAIVTALVGAPLAVGVLESLIAWGCKYFICCGGAGVLQKDIAVGHLIIPTSAIRDEGVSYHYLPPSRTVEMNVLAVSCIEETLKESGVAYLKARTWTTDALYRETRDKVNLRVAEGCVTVEMEAAAYMAVAKFRGVTFGQILYAGDDLSGELWDKRAWNDRIEIRKRLLELSIEAAIRMKVRGSGDEQG